MQSLTLNNIKLYVIYPIFFLILLLGVRFTFLPAALSKLVLIIFLPIFIAHVCKYKRVNTSISLLLLYMFCIYLFLIAHSTFMQTYDYSYTYVYLLNLVEFSFTSLLIIYLLKNELIKDNLVLFKIIVISILLHSLFIHLNVFVPSTRISMDLIPMGGNIDEFSLFRVRGLALSPNAGLSVMHSIGAVLAFFLFNKTKIYKEKVFYSFIMFLILGSTLFISRTGFFLFFIIVIIYSVLFNFHNIKNNIKNTISFLFSIFAIVLVLYAVSITFLDKEFALYILDKLIPWAFELFISDDKSSFLESRSTNDVLDNMIFFPENQKTWLIGDGRYDGINGIGHYIPSDSGYIRSLYAVGLFGMIFIYSFIPFILLIFKNNFRQQKEIFNLLIVIVFALFLIEIKMPFIFSGLVIKLIYLILFSSIYYYPLQKVEDNHGF